MGVEVCVRVCPRTQARTREHTRASLSRHPANLQELDDRIDALSQHRWPLAHEPRHVIFAEAAQIRNVGAQVGLRWVGTAVGIDGIDGGRRHLFVATAYTTASGISQRGPCWKRGLALIIRVEQG
jgi:hypothetical protein